jgi:diaminohydroxyphosphoribosylaminopyrimidine deaminase / 5-amino-6-(5-phosphoribosylamino)uracil reductase
VRKFLNCPAHGRVDLVALLQEFGRQGINEVHVEAGATLNGALLAAGLVDEWIAYQAPVAMGHAARGLFDMPELTEMADGGSSRCAMSACWAAICVCC